MRLPFAVDSLACARVAIMLIPSYTAAALTGEMVWTTPTLAGASALAASLKRPEDPTRAVAEGDTDDASSEDAGPARQLVDGPARRGLAADGRVGGAPGWTHRPPPAGATTPAIASRSLLFEQIPSVFEQVASAALVTSSPGRGARQLARRRPCFPELQVELSGARRVAVAAAAVGEGSGGNRRRDSACVPSVRHHFSMQATANAGGCRR